MSVKFSLSSKVTFAALLLLFMFLANVRYQQWRNQVAIEAEKRKLQEETASLSRKNQDLSDSLSYLGSADFKDRMARQQLNLKREGEVVFGFVDAPPQMTGDGAKQMPNYEKWIQYFFGTE